MTINTTKTYDFNPSLGGLLLTAFRRAQISPTEITQSHLYHGQQAANFILSEFSALQPNLWEVGLTSFPLLSGQATYSLPSEIVMILDLYLSYGSSPNITDRYLNPISRSEYASIPNKTDDGFPSQYWFNRLISPTVTFWLVPDDDGPYVARYYSVRQTQDALATGGKTVEVPYRFLEAYTAGLSWKIAELYAPQLEERLFARYQRAWDIASTNDTENVPMYIIPGLSGYYRP